MVAPVTGPFTVVEDFAKFYRIKTGYKQTKPFTLPTAYHLRIGERLKATGSLETRTSIYTPTQDLEQRIFDSVALNQAKIHAYDKLKSQISDRASMGENVLQFRKSLGTITNRALQLYDFTRAVKRGNLGVAAEILRTPMPRKKHPVKEQANNWLEFHLGIAPVVGDIYAALDVLQNPIKHAKAKGRGKNFFELKKTSANDFSPGLQHWKADIRVQYQAEVAISNPNLYLANTLGITNPAVVLWQMIPLSFVLDWFVNMEQFLGTASDFLGLTVLNASTTCSWNGTFQEIWNTYGWEQVIRAAGTKRELGLTLPSLSLRPYKATSWQRGLTAASLLVGSLKSLDQTNYHHERRHLKYFKFDKNLQSTVAPPYDWALERRARRS